MRKDIQINAQAGFGVLGMLGAMVAFMPMLPLMAADPRNPAPV